MLIIPPPKYRKRHAPEKRAAIVAPPVALTLVSAEYVPDQPAVVLAFDRAIDIAALDGSAIIVDDGIVLGNRFDGERGAELLDAVTVEIDLTLIPGVPGGQVLLIASAGNGIVAVDDGGAWDGTAGVVMPFP